MPSESQRSAYGDLVEQAGGEADIPEPVKPTGSGSTGDYETETSSGSAAGYETGTSTDTAQGYETETSSDTTSGGSVSTDG
ncbi:hypothetical protein [Mycobacterium sp. 050134]|uniref:hypothetical protein n=1 Tax=Mycobacterium sp. 050134 TaxID=3096111 RepID=UPI002ED9401E